MVIRHLSQLKWQFILILWFLVKYCIELVCWKVNNSWCQTPKGKEPHYSRIEIQFQWESWQENLEANLWSCQFNHDKCDPDVRMVKIERVIWNPCSQSEPCRNAQILLICLKSCQLITCCCEVLLYIFTLKAMGWDMWADAHPAYYLKAYFSMTQLFTGYWEC